MSFVYQIQPGASISTGLDNQGNINAYNCATVSTNDFAVVPTPYYYDLVYPCQDSVDDTMQGISLKLLNRAALAYRILPSGAGCFVPPLTDMNWVAGVNANPVDTQVTEFGCQKLSTTDNQEQDQCCVVVQGAMEFVPSGEYIETEFRRFVADQLNSPDFFANGQTAFIGSELETNTLEGDSAGALPPAVSSIETTRGGDEEPSVSITGAFVITGLAAAAVAALAIVFRRRQRKNREFDNSRFEPADDQDDYPQEYNDPDRDPENGSDGGDSDAMRMAVLSDELHRSPNAAARYNDTKSGSEYTFDLGNSLKNDVMGTYGNNMGPSSMPVVAPYPMSETSDSEADSWAQTDGTVGSLEDRLEEITAEI